MAIGSRGLLVRATVNPPHKSFRTNPPSATGVHNRGWGFDGEVFVVGEVFPKGGVTIQDQVPLPRESEGCAAGARLKNSRWVHARAP